MATIERAIQRAYSLISVKEFDAAKRTFTGLATSPIPDRLGDVVAPDGVEFKNPLPLLLYHSNTKPVGEARFGKATKDGIPYRAQISTLDRESGVVKERLDEAVDSLAANPPLIRGVSIGFRPLEEPEFIRETGGFLWPRVEVVELSMVVIPANQAATIEVVKSLDAAARAALGQRDTSQPAGVSAHREATSPQRKVSVRSVATKTINEQIKDFEGTRETKRTRMTELMTKSAEAGETLDASDSEEYDRLKGEVETINTHIQRLVDLEEINKKSAVAVVAKTANESTTQRGGGTITVNDPKLEPGIPFARAAIAKMAAFLDGGSPLQVAKARWPSHTALHAYLEKAAVPAGTTLDAVWASPLVDSTNLPNEFIEYVRPMTIIGKFGANGIPALRRVPFNIRVIGATSGGNAYWVGQGAPKPLTSYAFSPTTLGYTKVAAIAVITEELARFSSPAAEPIVRDALAGSVVERIDIDFIDPAAAAVTNVQPASLTNGLTALSSAGTSADNVRTDLTSVLSQFIAANVNPASLVLIMPNTLAVAVSLMRNSLGQAEFNGLTMNGGTLEGIPVITSQYLANASGYGNLVVAVNASDVFLADDGDVRIDASREASLQMLDNPTNNSSTATATQMVSMFQTNSIALRAERFINWAKRRSDAVVYMDDVNWGSVGSP